MDTDDLRKNLIKVIEGLPRGKLLQLRRWVELATNQALIEEVDREPLTEEEKQKLARAMKELKEGKTIPWHEAKKELGL